MYRVRSIGWRLVDRTARSDNYVVLLALYQKLSLSGLKTERNDFSVISRFNSYHQMTSCSSRKSCLHTGLYPTQHVAINSICRSTNFVDESLRNRSSRENFTMQSVLFFQTLRPSKPSLHCVFTPSNATSVSQRHHFLSNQSTFQQRSPMTRRLIVRHWTLNSSTLTSVLTSERFYSNGRPGDTVMNVFDRRTKRIQRNRTAMLDDYEVYDYLKEEVGWRMADRMSDVKRKFEVAVDLGCGRGHIGKHVLLDNVGLLYQTDMADKVLAQTAVSPEVPTFSVVADEEFFPFRNNSLDLVISSLSLHWVNDLPGTFKQVHMALKGDGCFMGAMFGGDTLHELRVSLQLAELEKHGGFAAHISPFTSAQDLGGLLGRTGYVMLTIDVDEIIVNFPSIVELMRDLKGMGESNCAWSRRPLIHRDTIKAAGAIYKDKFGNKEGVPAMFQILHFIAWKPDPTQPRVAERGSGQVSLKDIDKLDEVTRRVDDLKSTTPPGGSTDRTIAALKDAIEKARRGGAGAGEGGKGGKDGNGGSRKS